MRNARTALLFFAALCLTACGGGGGSSSFNSGTTTTTSSGMTGSGGTLSITTTSLPDGLTAKPYSANIGVSGGSGRLTFALASGSFFPAGLALDPATGSISGTVSNAVLGDVTFKVTDSGNPQQTALRTIRMTFRWALSITTQPIPVAPGHVGVPYKEAFYAGGANGNVTWSVSTGQLPPGLSLTNTTSSEADLVGTPTQSGSYAFTVQTVDSSSPPQTATYNATVAVDSKLAIATVNLPVPYANEAYSQTITAVNGTPPYHWAFGQYHPQNLAIDASTGVVSGTPYQGNYWMDVTVTDSATPAQTAQQEYGLLILPRLSVPPMTLSDAHLSQNYYAYLNHNGGQGNLVWSIVSGALPPGITMQTQYAVFSGTPTQLGTYTFTVQVQDSSTPPQVAQGQFTINVLAAVLSLQPSLPARIPINVPFDGAAVVSGGTAPFTFTINAGTLPAGLSLNASTGEVSGTPTTASVSTVTLKATDSSNPVQTSSLTYTMTVGPALGRNDSVATATKLGNASGSSASISPLVDPSTASVIAPDSDYYHISAIGGSTVKVNVNAYAVVGNKGALDPVLEFVDANGARLSGCRLPGDTTSNFNSSCINDDIVQGTNVNSQLEYLVQGTSDTKVDIFAHVFDWRGDARPDMLYSIVVSGAFVPIVFNTPAGALPNCVVQAQCYFNLAAKGGTGNLNAKVTAGALPPGVNLIQGSFTTYDGSGTQWTGTMSGSPTSAGTYNFTLTITDSATPQQSVSQQFSMVVYPALTQSPIPAQTLKVGQTTTVQASATGGIAPITWSLPGAPTWVKIDPNTGLITFQPTTAGQYSIQVWAIGTCDACGGTLWNYQTVSVTVNP